MLHEAAETRNAKDSAPGTPYAGCSVLVWCTAMFARAAAALKQGLVPRVVKVRATRSKHIHVPDRVSSVLEISQCRHPVYTRLTIWLLRPVLVLVLRRAGARRSSPWSPALPWPVAPWRCAAPTTCTRWTMAGRTMACSPRTTTPGASPFTHFHVLHHCKVTV